MEKNRFSTYSMMDKLANIQADLSNEELKTSSVFKQITGGDAIEVEKKLGAQFPTVLPLKFIFSANNPPQVPDYEPAFFRRWILMEFAENFEGKEIQGLERTLTQTSELSGLFNRVQPLLRQLLQNGRFTHAPTTDATRELYLTLSRPLYGFIKECLVYPDEGLDCTPKSDFLVAYKAWALKNKKPVYGAQDFFKRLQTEPEIAGLFIDTKMPASSPRARENAFRGVSIKPEFRPSQKISNVQEVFKDGQFNL
jgi:phage/plasmid-associated DNA primase